MDEPTGLEEITRQIMWTRLRAVVESPQELRELLGRLVNEGGVSASDTRLVVERHAVGGLPGTALDER